MTYVVRPVKHRPYDATSRRQTSEATRQRILGAADELLRRTGYAATTVAAIAAAAAVSVDTVYTLVGTKPAVVCELIELALSGTDRQVAAIDRPYVAAIRAEPHARRKLILYATATRRMLERLAPLFSALRDAAGADPSAADLWRNFSDRRAANMRTFVEDVVSAPGTRRGIDIDSAADTIWLTNSPEAYLMLTVERGWSPQRYEAWLAETWAQLLLDPRSATG